MKTRVPAVEGWFTTSDEPALIGARGTTSGSFFFPTAVAVSGNPSAPGEEREEVLLSRRGRVWSWTTNHYAPPEPYVSPELERERMVVLGALADGVDAEALEVGTEVELEVGPLYEDDDHEYVVWKWRPV
jgi:uncharacterized OB-fold protein